MQNKPQSKHHTTLRVVHLGQTQRHLDNNKGMFLRSGTRRRERDRGTGEEEKGRDSKRSSGRFKSSNDESDGGEEEEEDEEDEESDEESEDRGDGSDDDSGGSSGSFESSDDESDGGEEEEEEEEDEESDEESEDGGDGSDDVESASSSSQYNEEKFLQMCRTGRYAESTQNQMTGRLETLKKWIQRSDTAKYSIEVPFTNSMCIAYVYYQMKRKTRYGALSGSGNLYQIIQMLKHEGFTKYGYIVPQELLSFFKNAHETHKRKIQRRVDDLKEKPADSHAQNASWASVEYCAQVLHDWKKDGVSSRSDQRCHLYFLVWFRLADRLYWLSHGVVWRDQSV